MNDRLHRIEQILGQVAESVNANTEQIVIVMQAVDRLANVQLQMLESITEMQSQVRGLQTENRRILERLENKPESWQRD